VLCLVHFPTGRKIEREFTDSHELEDIMGRQAKTQRIIDEARDVLSSFHPMTVRQVYYQLVSRQVVENNRSRYQAVSDALVDARLEKIIPWDWIEDRLRRPRIYGGYDNLAQFARFAQYEYQRDAWKTQPRNVEIWLEKDALSGVFIDVIGAYRVTLNVGRGYDGWSSIHNASERFKECGKETIILYFGDFDPSGEDMVRSLRDRLAELGSTPEVIKVALGKEDVTRYNLPPNLTKSTDARQTAFVAKHGDISVELDALQAPILQQMIRDAVEQYMDLEELKRVKQLEVEERHKIVHALVSLS